MVRFGRAQSFGVAVFLVVAVAATGCGDDEKGVSKAQFVKRADTVCKRHYSVISAAAAKVLAGGKLPSRREFGKLAMGTIVPQYTAQIAELGEVEAPEASKAQFAKWLKDSEAVRGQIMADPSKVANPQVFASVNGQADRLGLSRECHVGPE